MKGLIKYYFIVWYCIFTALIRHLKKEKKYSLGRLAQADVISWCGPVFVLADDLNNDS